MADEKPLTVAVTLGGSSFEASGPADLVMEAFGQFKALVPKEPAGGAGVGGSKVDDTATPTPPKDSAAAKTPLAEFLKREAINGNAKRVAAIVIWAADHERKSSITRDQVKEYWREKSPVKLPENLPRDIKSAVKQGYLHQDGDDLSPTEFGRTAIGLS